MKVYLDGQEYSEVLGLADAPSTLKAVRGEVSRTGRVITEIKVDGVTMDEEAFMQLTGGLNAHFTSQPVRVLVRESLDEAVGYIPRLTKGLEEIAFHFDHNEISEGQKKLADASEGLDWLLSVFHNCSALLAVGQETAGSGIEELKKSLTEDINSLGQWHEKARYSEMAQGIRQKLVPDIEKFHLYVQQLRDVSASTQ